MIEKALRGTGSYFAWLAFLLIVIGTGFLFYLKQLDHGLGITGMSRDVSWGLYIGQFTFLDGIAASAVMLTLPYYLHNYKAFGKVTILAQFLAVASVTMCMIFVIVDLGQPMRAFYMVLYPTPNSMLFWDMTVLNGYLFLNIVIGWTILGAERKGAPPPNWVKSLIYISIPWAISLPTVAAFLYAGLPGRGFWLTAIMAPRFLASAFASGPALLILLCLFLKRTTKFRVGEEAIQTLSKIVSYAMTISIFFLGCEFFTVYYSQITEHTYPFTYLFEGLDGHSALVPWMWACVILAIVSLILLLNPKTRNDEVTLAIACGAVFFSVWIEKGIILVPTGFVPNPFEGITQYAPTIPEIGVTLGVWGLGFLILTVLYKVAIRVREEEAQ